jgi:hypothetical protein
MHYIDFKFVFCKDQWLQRREWIVKERRGKEGDSEEVMVAAYVWNDEDSN